MKNLFNTFLVDPMVKTLTFFYDTIALEDFGLAIIFLTLLIRIVLYPLFYKQGKQQAIIQKIQPRLKEIQKKHKQDKGKLMEETMKIYKKHAINPLSTIFLLLVQLPILLALFSVIRKSVAGEAFDNVIFLGFIDLREVSLIIAAGAAILQFIQMQVALGGKKKKKTVGDKDPAAGAANIMKYAMPGLIFFFLTSMPSALGIYWMTSMIFGTIQQKIINRSIDEEDVDEELEEIEEEAEGLLEAEKKQNKDS